MKLLRKKQNGFFEHRFDDRLNENNWNHQECLVLCNGRVVNINPEDDALFREAEQLPQEARYQWARLTALRCVANKLEFGVDPLQPSAMKAHWDDFDSLMTQIMLEVPPRLAALWAKGPMLLTTDSPADNWLDRSCRDVWGRQMELLLRSMERHKPPFSRDGSPYECCAFDLSRGSDNKEHDAILFVDIHTLSVALAPAPGARSTAGGGTQSGLRLGRPASKSPRNANRAASKTIGQLKRLIERARHDHPDSFERQSVIGTPSVTLAPCFTRVAVMALRSSKHSVLEDAP